MTAKFWSINLKISVTESVAIDTWKECTQENKEFRGASISSSVGISNVEECVAYCQTVEGCVGVTYTKSSNTCTAKSKRTGDSIQPNNDAVSVSMMCLSKYLIKAFRLMTNETNYINRLVFQYFGALMICYSAVGSNTKFC